MRQTRRGSVYCAPIHAATGTWGGAGRGPSWHTFSAGFFPSIGQQRAFDQYRAQHAADLLVLPEGDQCTAIRCVNGSPVDFSGLLLDIYVAPRSFEWTMVFTHEHPDYGSYFSRAEWRHRTS